MELNPLAQIDPVIIGATIAVYTGSYFALRRVFFDPTVDVLETRAKRSEEASEACRVARESIEEADARAESVRAAARDEAEAIVARAREEAEALKVTRLAEARERTEAQLREGRAVIAEAREREVAALKAEARQCVGLACEKLAGAADPDVIESVVERLVAKSLA